MFEPASTAQMRCVSGALAVCGIGSRRPQDGESTATAAILLHEL